MSKRSFRGSNERVGKSSKVSKRSFSDEARRHLADLAVGQPGSSPAMSSPSTLGEGSPKLNEESVLLVVGRDQRLFAAHEDVLNRFPWFALELSKDRCARDQFSPGQKTIHLPDDEPQVISAILEYMAKGDYTPRLVQDRRSNQWSVDDSAFARTAGNGPSTRAQDSDETITHLNTNRQKKVAGFNDLASIFHSGVDDVILRDTAVYCAAQRFHMSDLQRLALYKQGRHIGIDVATILRSATFAYANTPEGETKLRAHYLTLIIRNRATFLQSGTMQMEMEKGGTRLFFDLFVALCQHLDDVSVKNAGPGLSPGHSPGMLASAAAAASSSSSPIVNKERVQVREQERSRFYRGAAASTSTISVGCSPCKLINAARDKRPDYTGRKF